MSDIRAHFGPPKDIARTELEAMTSEDSLQLTGSHRSIPILVAIAAGIAALLWLVAVALCVIIAEMTP